MWNIKDVYYVSDSTAIIAGDIGKSLLCQFPDISFNEEKIPFVRSKSEAKKAIAHILEQSAGLWPIVFCTIKNKEIRDILDVAEVEMMDLYGGFLLNMEKILETKALLEPCYFRKGFDLDNKTAERVDAIHFSLEHDDGQKTKEYDDADIIVVGVSRSGKTPVSIYLASHMGLKTANFPLTPDHLDTLKMPPDIVRNRKKTVGLTIFPQTLHRIRKRRFPDTNYSKLSTCTTELQQAEQMCMQHGIKLIQSDYRSIEELSVQVTQSLGISKKKWKRH